MKKTDERKFVQNHIADIEGEYFKIAQPTPDEKLFLDKKCLARVCAGYHLKLEIGVQRELTIKNFIRHAEEILREAFTARREHAQSVKRRNKQREQKSDQGFTDTLIRNQIFDLGLDEDNYWPVGQQ